MRRHKGIMVVAILGAVFGLSLGTFVARSEAGVFSQPRNLFGEFDPSRIEEGIARQIAFVREFVAVKSDARSLRRVEVMTWNPGPASTAEALAQAELVVVGRVTHTDFEANSSGGSPHAISTVVVERTLKGSPYSSIALIQGGGPVLTTNGPVLQQDDTGDLILPGDRVVLFMVGHPKANAFLALPAAGIYFVREEMVVPIHSNRFGTDWSGRSLTEFIATIRTLVAQ